MKLAVLHVRGMDWFPQEHLAGLAFEPDSLWHVGDARLLGRKCTDSGFSYTISDAVSTKELITAVRNFATENGDLLHGLASRGIEVEIDIGVSVGDSIQYTASVPFSANDLLVLGKYGIGLCVSAYPTSDEANADE